MLTAVVAAVSSELKLGMVTSASSAWVIALGSQHRAARIKNRMVMVISRK
jgi:hypothetical protein